VRHFKVKIIFTIYRKSVIARISFINRFQCNFVICMWVGLDYILKEFVFHVRHIRVKVTITIYGKSLSFFFLWKQVQTSYKCIITVRGCWELHIRLTLTVFI
jgi:hypothetical protein